MRIVRAHPSWAARVLFTLIGVAATVAAVACLESTIDRRVDSFLTSAAAP